MTLLPMARRAVDAAEAAVLRRHTRAVGGVVAVVRHQDHVGRDLGDAT
jgi:hypothetical protein